MNIELKKSKVNFRGKEVDFFVRKRSRSDKKMLLEVIEDDIYKDYELDINGKLVVDIGAYIGESAYLFEQMGASKVIAYEIHPIMSKVAIKNIELNCKNTELKRFGLHGKNGEIEILGHATDSFGIGKGPFLFKNKDTIKVSVKNANEELNSIIEKYGKIGLLKIDAETSEEQIISVMDKSLFDNIEELLIECHSKKITKAVKKKLEETSMEIKAEDIRKLSMNELTIIHYKNKKQHE